MPKITILEADGTERTIDAVDGVSLMSVAVQNNVRGIDAECGGAMSCATCHIHVPEEWISVTGIAQGDELDLVSFADGFDEASSRLSCQIVLDQTHEGLKVRIPG